MARNRAFSKALRKRRWGDLITLIDAGAGTEHTRTDALKLAAAGGQYDVVATLVRTTLFYPTDLGNAEKYALKNNHREIHALLHELIETLPEKHRVKTHRLTHPKVQAGRLSRAKRSRSSVTP